MNTTQGSQKVARLLEHWGQKVQVVTADEAGNALVKEGKAFIQPLRYKNKMYLGGNYLPPGYADGGHYLYIGGPKQRIDLAPFDTVVRTAAESYAVKKAEKVCLKDEVLYVWAVLQRYTEE